ncbi:MAG TPA: DUF4124 domain-containing protein [Usitatibacter sp.]|nr:DUF4124 domain-containing protein [Usitatibacter sp.]
MDLFRAFLLIIALLACAPAMAGVLYKSVDANGILTFSDMPPGGEARILEMRITGPRPGRGEPGAPIVGNAMEEAAKLLDSDPLIAQANARIDLAEHALALARRELWSPRDGLRLASGRRDSAAEDRVAFCKRDVLLARQALLELLRERRAASTATAAGLMTASNVVTRP